MKNIKCYIYLSLMLLSMSSCLKDIGNYSYNDINEVAITGLPDKAKFDLYAYIDTLKINVQVAGSQSNDDSRYTYEWKIMPQAGDDTVDSINHVIGDKNKLEYPISLDPGEYKGYLNVRDNVEGTRWTKTFQLLVRSLANEGYMVLSDEDGSGRLDMIAATSETTYRVAYDLWREESYQLGRPLGLFYNYNLNGSLTLYMTDQGTHRLDKNLKTSDRMNLNWLFGGVPDRVDIRGTKSTSFRSGNVREVMVDRDGKLYGRNPSLTGSLFEFPINKIGGTNEVLISPHIGMPIPNALASYYPNNHSMMLYDNTNKQFLEIRNTNANPTVMSFKSNNLYPVKTDRDIVHAQSTLNKYTFAILKEPSLYKYYLYGMMIGANNANSQEYYMEILMPNQEEIKHFAVHSTLPYVFYATANKVYQFDYSQPTNPAKLVLDYGTNQVKTLDFFPVVGWNAYAAWERNKADILVVGIVNQQEEGSIAFYNVPTLGAALQQKAILKGFGNIIDIAYRER